MELAVGVSEASRKEEAGKVAGAKLCRAYKPCQEIWTFFQKDLSTGGRVESRARMAQACVLGSPLGHRWRPHRRSGGGGWAAYVETGAVWSRQGLMRLRQGNVKDRGEGWGGGVEEGAGQL